MAVGIVVTQRECESEFAARIRQLNNMGDELRKIKATLDALGVAGMVALKPGPRDGSWTTEEATAFKAAVDALVGYFDGFTANDGGAAQAALNAMAGFGF